MSLPRPRVLAIGIDAAEPALVKKLMDQGELPSLKALRDHGCWGEVRSPAAIGSGAVWPTFMTGEGPAVHGVYSVLPWDPRTMNLVRLTTDHLTPFWRGLSDAGYAVGVLDVPFAPVIGLAGGAEISEWGAHDHVRGRMLVSPPGVGEWLARTVGDHPLGGSRVEVSGPGDRRALQRLAAMCRSGVRLRGSLATRFLAEWRPDVLIVVFPEVHHASHYLWHTVHSMVDSPLGSQEGANTGSIPGLIDVYREVDRQIGDLTRAVGEDATVLVFSLHGMRATRGIPTVLDPLVRSLGMAARRSWRSGSWSARRDEARSLARRIVPPPLRRLYRRASRSLVRLPQRYVPLAFDWPRTIAFPIPTDQHGWLRLNLRGREVEGAVDAARYDEVCAQLEQVLRGLRTIRGDRVVADVLRVGREAGHPPEHLPDLIVHWDDHALANPLRLASPRLAARPQGTRFTGQHAPSGFFLLRPAAGRTLSPGAVVGADELHRVVQAGMRA